MADYDWGYTSPEASRRIEEDRLRFAEDGYRLDHNYSGPSILVCLICGCDVADRQIHSTFCKPGERDMR